jgi:hypothetical protein
MQSDEAHHARRDHALQKTVAAFRESEAGAKRITGPLTIKIRLSK